MNIDYAALTDLYQITMAQGYFDHGMGTTNACFHMYFRNYPFKGGYAVACGLDQLAELVEGYRFSEEDIEYLAHTACYGDVRNGSFGGFVELHEEDVKAIYRLAL